MNEVKKLASDLIQRAMHMQTFKLLREIPDTFEFRGTVPFDVKINREGLMTFTVHALNLEEANAMVDRYLEENTF